MTRHAPRQLTRPRQRGAAIVTALLVVTLAVVIVSGMLWRQQVEIRAVENQRLKAQATWIARAGIDWARLILRDDQRRTGAVDHLGEIWAVPIQETKLSDFLGSSLRTDSAGEASYLSGRIFDAQARFNLMSLLIMQTLGARTIITGRDKAGIKAYGLLLQSLNLDPNLANVTATSLAQMLGGIQSAEGSQGGQQGGEDTSSGGSNGPRPLDDVDSLLTIPGYTAETVRKLRPYVIVLPTRTQINANTASAEVLAAVIPNLSLDRARALVLARDRAYFRNIGDVTNQLRGIAPGADTTAAANLLDVQTHYFLVYGMARHERAQIGQVALVSRGDPVNNNATRIVWVRRVDEIPQ